MAALASKAMLSVGLVFRVIALSVPACLMLAQMFFGCDRIASVTFFTLALTMNGAVTAGYLGNGLDIAPNFSGKSSHCTIFGMANTLSSLGGFLSSFMVGSLTYNNALHNARDFTPESAKRSAEVGIPIITTWGGALSELVPRLLSTLGS
uniref:Uncharacterized protein n=1 Tax=Timema monikensis TaxID=170555 RepID=A0A7R9EHX4_9NEOP|nr:unnamed protein product [Timema monikensis]